MCLSSNGLTSVLRTRIVPSARPSRSSGTARTVRWPNLMASRLAAGEIISHGQRISDMKWFSVADRTTHDVVRSSGTLSAVPRPIRLPKLAACAHRVVVDDNNTHELSFADAGGALGDRIEHGLDIVG